MRQRIPIALLGLFAAAVSSYLAAYQWGWVDSVWDPFFGLDVIPLGIVSSGLVVVQGMSVGAWCFLCLVTAAASLIMIPLAVDEVWGRTASRWGCSSACWRSSPTSRTCRR